LNISSANDHYAAGLLSGRLRDPGVDVTATVVLGVLHGFDIH
jgi:hypothetical protein